MSPREWNEIDEDSKREVIKYLDYESRCNLKLCSKHDYRVVNSTKFIASKIKIHETVSQFKDDKTIIRIDIDTFTIWFIGREEITRIDRGLNGELNERLSEIKQINRYDLLREFMDQFSYNSVFTAGMVEVDSLKLCPSPNWKFNFHGLSLVDVPDYRTWLRQLNSGLKSLHVGGDGEYTIREEISRMTITESLNLYKCIDVRDKDLRRVTATNLRIYMGEITAEWVKKAIKNYLENGKRKDEFNVKLLFEEKQYDPFLFIPESLVIQINEERSNEKRLCGEIIGGFRNTHGIQTNRYISIVGYSSILEISCGIL
uniref:F-box domain-containing protein n=1 Tax=Caenorhabditis tropicalis TaxID=1561998 RepID=A0A1I7U6U9_9PELO